MKKSLCREISDKGILSSAKTYKKALKYLSKRALLDFYGNIKNTRYSDLVLDKTLYMVYNDGAPLPPGEAVNWVNLG